jgi:hypothetical protein
MNRRLEGIAWSMPTISIIQGSDEALPSKLVVPGPNALPAPELEASLERATDSPSGFEIPMDDA